MHLRLKLATTAFAAGALVATLAPPTTAPPAVVTPSSPSGTTSTTPVAMVSTSSTPTRPRAFKVTIKALRGVKKGKLRRQKPRNTKRWKRRAARAIRASLHRRVAPKDGYRAVASFWFCALALARFVAEYGVPIAKVARVVHTAWKIFGGMKGILTAKNDGTLGKMLGEDAAHLIGAALGAGNLLNDCIL